MGILNSAARGLRRLAGGKGFGSLGQKFRDHKLNAGSWTEDIARGFGLNTRKRVATGAKRNVEGLEGRTTSAFPRQQIDVLENKLNATGMVAQSIPYLAGAGTLGAKMIAGTEPTKDKQGVETGMRNDALIKAREKYQQNIGGAKKFTPALLEHASRDSQWVKSAIKSMGMDKYKKLRARVANDKAGGNAAGVLHAALVDELAKVGDEEMLKQAATQDYVLPGLAKVGDDARRVIVITNQKDKDKKSSQMALQYEFDEGDDQ